MLLFCVVRTVLGQSIDMKLVAIYYTSKTLGEAHINYTTIEKESIASSFFLRRIFSYFLCRKVIKFIEHDALKFLVNKNK